MFKIVMIIAIIILALGWIAYGIWTLRIRAEEKNKPKPTSKRLQDTRSDIADYAEKLANFKKPTFNVSKTDSTSNEEHSTSEDKK